MKTRCCKTFRDGDRTFCEKCGSKRAASGFVLSAVAQNAAANVYLSGINNAISTTLTEGEIIYLDLAGGVTEAIPTINYFQELGVAVGENSLAFHPQEPIDIL